MGVAVVTGAGAGVGRATVREFARHGYDVGLIGRDALVAIGGLTRLYGLHRLLRRRR